MFKYTGSPCLMSTHSVMVQNYNEGDFGWMLKLWLLQHPCSLCDCNSGGWQLDPICDVTPFCSHKAVICDFHCWLPTSEVSNGEARERLQRVIS